MNMRDQLKKAKLLSDKKAKQLAHDARVERKEKGREQLEKESGERQQEVEQLRAKDRERTRREQAEIDLQRKQREEQSSTDALLAAAKKPEALAFAPKGVINA